MDDVKVKLASEPEEEPSLPAENEITEEEARELRAIMERLMAEYKKKAPEEPLRDWLAGQFKKELPELSDEEAAKFGKETVDTIEEYDKNLAEIKTAAEKGIGKEQWFAKKVQEASAGMAVAEYGHKLQALDDVINTANEQMMQTILRKDGAISQARNLDGFMAEQGLVNSFNMQAELTGSPYHAEVQVPVGRYGKNSFDVVIKDESGHIVHQYQMKYGADAKATIQMLKRGNYNNQIIVVPPEQVAEVQAAFPGKTVVSAISSPDGTTSVDLSKDAVKDWQKAAQEKGAVPEVSWNNYNTKELALRLGKDAAVAGMQAAVIGTGFHLAAKIFSGEDIDGDETVQVALETGADASVKSVAAGAMTVAHQSGKLNIIPKGTPISTIANIACVAVENVKILGKVASGELTVAEGLDQAGQTTTSMAFGIGWGATGATIGAAALLPIPVVGPALSVLGGLVGGMVGYMGGSKFGETIYNGAKKVISAGARIVKGAWEGVKSIGRSVFSGVRSFLGW